MMKLDKHLYTQRNAASQYSSSSAASQLASKRLPEIAVPSSPSQPSSCGRDKCLNDLGHVALLALEPVQEIAEQLLARFELRSGRAMLGRWMIGAAGPQFKVGCAHSLTVGQHHEDKQSSLHVVSPARCALNKSTCQSMVNGGLNRLPSRQGCQNQLARLPI